MMTLPRSAATSKPMPHFPSSAFHQSALLSHVWSLASWLLYPIAGLRTNLYFAHLFQLPFCTSSFRFRDG